MRFCKFTTKDYINNTEYGIVRFLYLIFCTINIKILKKYRKMAPKMHKVLMIDDKNMMFGILAANNHANNTAYGTIRFFNFCLFYVKLF